MKSFIKRLMCGKPSRPIHKFHVGYKITFLDYRAEGDTFNKITMMHVYRRTAVVVGLSSKQNKPTYSIVLFAAPDGVLRYVPESNIEPFVEEDIL